MSLLEELQNHVGSNFVLSTQDKSAFEIDWRKRQQGRALYVVSPQSTQEVAQVVKSCRAHGVSIVPQGGNTGLVVGSIPDESGTQVVLSLKRMKKIRHLDTSNLSVTVEAGCILQTLQEVAQANGLLFPLSLGSEGSCTLGGNLSTNAGGTQVLRFGNTRELCLGLEVVTAQGEIWSGLSALRKDNTGYDLKDLYIGSEGTLGIITAATMKLFPAPKSSLTAFAALNDIEGCIRLLKLAHQHLSAGLTGFEVMNQFSLELVSTHFPNLSSPLGDSPWCVLLELSDAQDSMHASTLLENLLSAALEQGVVQDAVVAKSLAESKHLWQIRESITLAQAQEGLNIKHDISLPVSQIKSFVQHTDHALALLIEGVRLVNFGHLGDGNLHYNVQAPKGVESHTFLAQFEEQVNELVYEQVKRLGGSISAEHGIGSLKLKTLPQYKDPVALALMRSIKGALDPNNLMNPNRVIESNPADH